MNLSYFIDETKKWIQEAYYDQTMIDIGHFEILPSKNSPLKENHKKISKDFIEPLLLKDVEIVTLILSNDENEVLLIEKLTHAIDTRIAKAKIVKALEIEKEDLWQKLISEASSLRYILISEMEFYKLPNLLKHYQAKPLRSVLNIPLFLLADLKCYNQDVELKKSLWANLLREL